MPPNTPAILALDVGSSRIQAVIATLENGGDFRIVGVGTSITQGMEKGLIVAPKALALAMDRAIKRAERECGIHPVDVLVSVPPAQTQFGISYGLVMPKPPRITREDRIACIQKSKAAIMTHDQVIQHVIPISYKVNGVAVDTPDDLPSGSLETSTFVVLMHAPQADHLLAATTQLGLCIKGLVYGPQGASYVCLSDDERKQGALLVDIGYSFTTVSLFKQGVMTESHALPIAGDRITKDLMTCLTVDESEAERLKVVIGSSTPDALDPRDTHVMSTLDRGRVDVKRVYIARIIEARTVELLQLVAKKARIQADFPYPIVLTGGGALLHGMAHTATQVWGHPVRVGPPQTGAIDPSHWDYPTALGLICMALRTGVITPPGAPRLWQRVRSLMGRNWF